MRVSKEIEITDTLSFSGLTEDEKTVNIPVDKYDYMKVFWDLTVEDADISAGENLQGVMKHMSLGEGDNKVFEIFRDELEAFIAAQEEDHDARYYDPTPTTQVETHGFAVIEGPFNLQGMTVPTFNFAVNKVQEEFGAAAAFALKIKIVMVRSEDDDASGVVFTRVRRGANVLHQLPLGPGAVTDILLLTDNVTEIALSSSNGMGGAHPSDMDINTKYPVQYVDNYNIFKNPAARVTGRYFIEDLFTEYYAGRQLKVECSDAQALTMFAKNVVVYA